jgi:hypothetical protein
VATFTGLGGSFHVDWVATFTGIRNKETGKYLGQLGGSQYAPDSINNPYGNYGSQFSNNSPNNPYATNPPVILDNNNK